MALINRDKKFCEAVSAIYTAAGCGSLPATGNSGASLVLTQNVGGMPRKVKPDFRQALSQGTGAGLTSLKRTCLMGTDGECVMLKKKNGLGKLPVLKASLVTT
eukprot:TRINITY_DN7907_c0_g1_i1.p1 TRINITY_DN7907_c0_g1~~TRINITY_DN7907_c0_g1_i1.p1  ORF type:complete len:103 (+),score=7.75 TRINITY_DN7907_c0_g1_i1:315-623(+)